MEGEVLEDKKTVPISEAFIWLTWWPLHLTDGETPDDQLNLKDYKKTNCLVNAKLKAMQSVAENIQIWYLEL